MTNRISNNSAILDKIGKKNTSSNQSVRVNQHAQSFRRVLDEKASEVKISKHAEKRLEMRNISLSDMNMSKINGAIEKAEKKGVKDALIIMDNNALITNIKSKTIVTAAKLDDLETRVITNIDAVVLV